MSSRRTDIARRRRALTAIVRQRPAPALLFVSTLGWATMVWLSAAGAAQHAGTGADPALGVHATHAGGAATAAPHELTVWVAMVLAMSPLLLMREVARLRGGSLRRMRGAVMLTFVTGYGVVWLLAGLAALPLASTLRSDARVTILAIALTIVWHVSPLRQRVLNVCHRTPRLRVFGTEAMRDAGRHGVITGAACAASCGPIMVLVLLASDAHLVAMIGATIVLTAERYRAVRAPRWRLPFVPARPQHVVLAADSRAPTGAR